MKAVMVMFDSLNRHYLPNYGCGWTHAPNFRRLAQRTVQFETSYVCSMPCIPARRDLHTGRPNFLHRSWGPLEPYDDSVPQLLRNHGVYTHLSTDHDHYFEDGGAFYHNRFNSYHFSRGQEADRWWGLAGEPLRPEKTAGRNASDDEVVRINYRNRAGFAAGEPLPIRGTFDNGLAFIERNHGEDSWFLQIETFDPHEPFISDPEFKKHFEEHYREYAGPEFDWPLYEPVCEPRDQVEHVRYEYAATLAQCDWQLGRVLDKMDEHGLWEDTLLIVCTDHGFCLGERGEWAKYRLPWYEETAHTPFWVWDPRAGRQGEQRRSLVQPSIDIPVTLLDYFGLEPAPDMLGKNLRPVVEDDTPVREAGIFGVFGHQVNVTDGRYVYMRATQDPSVRLYQYTYIPTHMMKPFGVDELAGSNVRLAEPFSFTKGCHLMKIGQADPMQSPEEAGRRINRNYIWSAINDTMLFDLKEDPWQRNPIGDAAVEERMLGLMKQLMEECDAPEEQFRRLKL